MTTTSERKLILRKMRGLRKRRDRAAEQLNAMERERAELYTAGRSITPPLTFREIAEAFGVTEAAVMQKVRRHEIANGKKARKPKTTATRAG